MRNWLAFVSVSLVAAACGSDSKNPAPTVTCGTGTVLSGDMCVPDGSGSGSNVTCGTGTHLSGTMCVPDTTTPGAPSISAITPDHSGATGFILFQLTGSNLAGVDASMVHVYFGDTTPGTAQTPNPCEATVGAVDDTTLAGEVPPMCTLSTATTVTLVTDQGMATTAFHYDALFATDGDPNGAGVTGDLYIIDPYAQLWFDLGPPNDGVNTYSFDAVAFDGTGALWAITTGFSQGDTNGIPQLVTISLTDGTVAIKGELSDATDNYYVTDMKFSGTTLYAWGYNYTATTHTESLVSIDTTTAAVTVIGTPTTTTYGFSGLAIDGTGTVWVANGGASGGDTNLTPATGAINTVDTTTGVSTLAQTLDYIDNQGNPMGAPIDALDFIGTTMIGIVDNGLYGQFSGAATSGTQLVVIDPTIATGSGNIGAIFELPAQNTQASIVSGIAMAPSTLTIARKFPRGAWQKLHGTGTIAR